MKKKLKHIDPNVIDRFYHKNKVAEPKGPNKCIVLPTNKLDVTMLSQDETKVSWSYSELFGNPHLIITETELSNDYQFEKKGLIWFLISNGIIMPVGIAIFLIVAKDAELFALLKFLGIVCIFWWSFIYFISTVIYKSIIKNVEKQLGKMTEKEAIDDKKVKSNQ